MRQWHSACGSLPTSACQQLTSGWVHGADFESRLLHELYPAPRRHGSCWRAMGVLRQGPHVTYVSRRWTGWIPRRSWSTSALLLEDFGVLGARELFSLGDLHHVGIDL